MLQLLKTDSYYVPYLLVFTSALFAICANTKENNNNFKEYNLVRVFSTFFSLAITFANYKVWSDFSLTMMVNGGTLLPVDEGILFHLIYIAVCCLITAVGSWCAFYNILLWIARNINKIVWKINKYRIRPIYVFVIMFVGICIINMTILFCSQYPGVLTPDSISQVEQLLQNNYSNHHPFYHTLLIKLFVMIGMKMAGDINVGVACYAVFQIVVMAMIFAYTIMTFVEIGIHKKWIIIAAAFYVLMPYHIMYSFTIWKDVLFGGFVLMFVVSCYRCLKKVGIKVPNYIFLAVSSLGICLFRSNGFFAFVIVVISGILLFKNKEKKVICIMVCAMCLGFFMKHIALSNMGVTQPDLIESLSIPVQQIARVITAGKSLTEDETYLIGEIVDIDLVSNSYKDYISDPIKYLVREKGNQQMISEHKWEYIKAYITIGLRNPILYVTAWIDETKGYINGGYSYWRWQYGVYDNDFGIYATTKCENLNRLFEEYVGIFEENPILQGLLCIGLFVWLDVIMLFIGILRKDKYSIFATIPLLAVVLSLLIATPVFSEFRYAYSVFCALPVVIAITLCPSERS
jgi:hypothetical protein